MKRFICLISILSILITCTSCSIKKAEYKPYSTSFECFDTRCTITLYDEKPTKKLEKIADKLTSICIECDELFDMAPNRYRNISSGKIFGYSEYYPDIASHAIKYSKLTYGAFDITISPIVKLWNIQSEDFKIPKDSQIKKKLKLVNYKRIKDGGNLYTIDKNQTIDLGAIAKGYVTDVLVDELKNNKIKSAIIDLGGNIYAHGSKNKSPFKIGIKKPFRGSNLSATVLAKDTSVITAGIYQRYKKVKGKIYSHIMDPKTGRPVDNDLNSVTVISKNATAADALSTGFMVMGLDKGMKLANKTKGVEAVFIDKDNKLHLTNGLNIKKGIITIK